MNIFRKTYLEVLFTRLNDKSLQFRIESEINDLLLANTDKPYVEYDFGKNEVYLKSTVNKLIESGFQTESIFGTKIRIYLPYYTLQ